MASIRTKGDGHEIVFTDRSREPNQVAIYYGSDYPREEVVEIKKRLEEYYRWGMRDPWKLVEKKYNPRVETAIKNYIHHKQHETEAWSSKHTLEANKKTVEMFGRTFADLKLNDLTQSHIDEFINRPNLARATRKSYLRDVNAFLNWANLDIETPPIRGDKQEKQISYILESEVQKINQTILNEVHDQIERGVVKKTGPNSLWLVNLLTWSFYSGMRPAETLQLRHEDYEPESGIVHVRHKTKTSKPRTLPIQKVDILVRIMETMTDPKMVKQKSKDPTWKTDRIFGHYDVRNTSKKIKKYIKKAFKDRPQRAKKLKWYSYRHGCAVWLLANDVPIYTVSQWLGHASVDTTQDNYADITSQDISKQISRAHKG